MNLLVVWISGDQCFYHRSGLFAHLAPGAAAHRPQHTVGLVAVANDQNGQGKNYQANIAGPKDGIYNY
jgi:hypothetical protein